MTLINDTYHTHAAERGIVLGSWVKRNRLFVAYGAEGVRKYKPAPGGWVRDFKQGGAA